MEEFEKGDYIVLLSSCDGTNCWMGSIPTDYCYKLSKDSNQYAFSIEEDINGIANGWIGPLEDRLHVGVDKLDMRYATEDEICEYTRLGKPYRVKELKNKEDYTYLIDLFEKLNIR